MVLPVTEAAWEDQATSGLFLGMAGAWSWEDCAPYPLVTPGTRDAWQDIAPAAQWRLAETTPQRSIYIATLKADGLDDLEVPMSSMQLRRRDGQPTYALVVVPDAVQYSDDVTPYKDGEILIEAGVVDDKGTRHLSELTRVALDYITEDTGARQSSLSIYGYRTYSNTNPRTVEISGVSFYGLQANGKTRFRCPVDLFLRPGDIAIIDPYGIGSTESVTVEIITVNIDPRNRLMEVTGS